MSQTTGRDGADGRGRPGEPWRTTGVAALGLVGGFLAALVLQDVLGRGLLGALLPVLSVLGVGVALLVDRRARRRG
ncbi:hypothetical protein DT076_16905 [Desertihabitans brevis]|uniref:Uncharacterized protein n=1 Tax=Desertihabitans brevis TaxID=2268447 RepID=A0A367YR69_9ACTN|nr:hypothetical protein [Desertihabitans brevis]RCK68324.1 hypothetical protein DT076_16905 [Desertihabitans brevis]